MKWLSFATSVSTQFLLTLADTFAGPFGTAALISARTSFAPSLSASCLGGRGVMLARGRRAALLAAAAAVARTRVTEYR
jgi:hypothetical protein